jgi:hypothetical protein
MAEITCAEKTSDAHNSQDAVWVENEAGNRLYYPYVSSCVTVTLVFENGLLGGRATRATPDTRNPKTQPERNPPEQNLLDVIERMRAAAPDEKTRGAFLKIYFIGTTSDEGWNLDQAMRAVTACFGQPGVATQTNFSPYPMDIAFDTRNPGPCVVRREKSAESWAKTLREAKALVSVQNC